MNELSNFIKTKLLWHPFKTLLLIITIGISTILLIVSFGISRQLNAVLLNVSKNGTSIMSIVNAKKNEDDSLRYQIPPALNASHKTLILTELPEIESAAIITQVIPWERITVNNKSYRPSRPIGGDESILDVFDLPIIYGNNFTKEDIKNKNYVMLISESAAQALWGNPKEAVGKTILVNRMLINNFQRNSAQFQQPEVTTDVFTVLGVYRTPTEIERSAYSASDFIIPYTVQQQQGMSARFGGISTMMIRTTIQSPEKVIAKIQSVLGAQAQNDIWLTGWKGGASERDALYLESSLDTANRFSIIFNGISFFIVLISVLGILSALLIEIMDHRKTLGILRTFGLTKIGVIKRFIMIGFYYGFFGVIFGCLLALIFGEAITAQLVPMFELFNLPTEFLGSVVTPESLIIGCTIVLFLSLLSALAPALAASQMEIITTIKAE